MKQLQKYVALLAAILCVQKLSANIAYPIFITFADVRDVVGYFITMTCFAIEWACMYSWVQRDAVRMLMVTMLMNVASGIVGLGILYVLGGLAFLGGFPLQHALPHATLYFLVFFLISVAVNTLVETPVAGLFVKTSRRTLLRTILLINMLSMGFGIMAVVAYDAYKKSGTEQR